MTRHYIIGVIVGIAAALVVLHPGELGAFVVFLPRLLLLTTALLLPPNALVLANVIFLLTTSTSFGIHAGILRLTFLSSMVGLFGRLPVFFSAVTIVPFVWLLWLGFSGLNYAGVQAKGMFLDLVAVSIGEILAVAFRRRYAGSVSTRPDPARELLPFFAFFILIFAWLMVRPLLEFVSPDLDPFKTSGENRALYTFVSCSVLGFFFWGAFRALHRSLSRLFDSAAEGLLPDALQPSRRRPGNIASSALSPATLPEGPLPPGEIFIHVGQQLKDLSTECGDLRHRIKQLKRTSRELTTVLEDLPHPTLILNGDGLIVLISPSLQALLGVNVEEPHGTSFLTLSNSESPFAKEFVAIVEECFESATANGAFSKVVFTKEHSGESLKLTIAASNVYHADLDRESTMLSVFAERTRHVQDFALDLLKPQVAEILGNSANIDNLLKGLLEQRLVAQELPISVNLKRALELVIEQVENTLHLVPSALLTLEAVNHEKDQNSDRQPSFDVSVPRRPFGGILRYLTGLLCHLVPLGNVKLRISAEEIGSGTGTFVLGAYPGRFVKFSISCPTFDGGEDLSKSMRDPSLLGMNKDYAEIEYLLYLLNHQARTTEGFLVVANAGEKEKKIELFLPESLRPDEVLDEATNDIDFLASLRANAVFLGADAKLAHQLQSRLASIGFEMVFKSIDETLTSMLPAIGFEGMGFIPEENEAKSVGGEEEAEVILKDEVKPEARPKQISWGARRIELLIVEISRLDPETERLLELLESEASSRTRFLLVPESLRSKMAGRQNFRVLVKPIDEGMLEVEVQAALYDFNPDEEPERSEDSAVEA